MAFVVPEEIERYAEEHTTPRDTAACPAVDRDA